MSLYEKIASIIIALLVIGIVVFSYREFKEPPAGEGAPRPHSGFDQSIGQDFIIGPYSQTVSSHASGGLEDNCADVKPVILGTLHDIKERLEHLKSYSGTEDAFEVNEQTLQLFCNKTASITLADAAGNTLLLQKVPFVRAAPQGGDAGDVGTEVRINATLVPKGAPVPAEPTTFGDELIPDRYLDAATSSAS